MPDAKGANYGLKGSIHVWQRIGARLVKTNIRIESTRKLDHSWGEIATRRQSATVGGCTSKMSGTGRNVEQASTSEWLHRIKQRNDSLVRYGCKKLSIACRDTIMRVPLKLAERIYVNFSRHR
jgi:hypothetical protein